MTIRAAELRIVGQGQLNGNRGDGGGSFTVETDGDIRIDGTRPSGAVQLSGIEGGTLTLRSASGRVFGAAAIIARSAGDPLGDGGFVDIATGGSVNLTGSIDLLGGLEAGGGSMDVVATGDVSLTGLVNLQGGEDGGGTLFVDSEGRVTLGELQLDGQGELGDAGSLDVTGESALLNGRIRGRGSNNLEFCGDSSELAIDVTGLLDIPSEIDLNSRRDCVAGTLDLAAGIVSLRGPIRIRAEGTEGTAGIVTAVATERIECFASVASIDGRGDDSGGTVSLQVDSLEPATETTLDCDIDLSGPQGDFELDANTNVSINQNVLVGESGTAGTAVPAITIEGCTVRIGASAALTSRGGNASNRVIAREQTSVAGVLRSDAANELHFRPGLEPMVTGQILPAPSLVADESLLSCGFTTGTPTITRTATVTRTPTPTPSPPLVCVGDCNEDGVVGVDELVLGIDISLGGAAVSACAALDGDGSGEVEINENISAVSNSLNDCAIVR
jgi:hypothetical protein